MAIKEVSISYRTYYKTMRNSIKPKYEGVLSLYERKRIEEKAFYDEIKLNIDKYKDNYNLNLMDYKEFVENSYITGDFLKVAKSLFVNRKQNYILSSLTYDLYKFARCQKELYDIATTLHKYEQMLDLSMEEYRNLLQSFYTEVHKKMVVDGYGYVFEQPLGWVCINRCKVIPGAHRKLNFQATKQNKERLIKEGKRLWNKEEAEYARSIGAEYNGVDYRVYLDAEYIYEIALVGCKLSGGHYRIYAPYSKRQVVGKTDEQLIEECGRDKNKICELNTDIKLKLKLCLKIDDLLYLNFIRNEAQQSINTPAVNRKNRQ